ncbi:bifunctional aspartate kinase/homoserine dehydrogenase II [Mergibacter septicus]|uniref:bifunctional aspartate kinase/homoserine dehydrogenase II n=1 Tax=Mergibacter septicus TaxID=221402 RepID=UPI001C76021A|nr:bifunctional aspartate kinase/homoserine dehydrogenase II [Mergibacter septicus]QDJ13103.1 bifunctional aspartate kinase/homoserine dehydrogenase II [Mergibacter septicus]
MNEPRSYLEQRKQVHKFGGSSLASAELIKAMANNIHHYGDDNDLIIVSAMGKTTNHLIEWVENAIKNPLIAHRILQTLKNYYLSISKQLLADPEPINREFLDDLLHLSALLDQPFSDQIYAEVVGHGEIWSARLIAAYLTQLEMPAIFIDARHFMFAEHTILPQVNESISRAKLQQILVTYPNQRLVITGFISRNQHGETVLLGRNGSDYSATQIAALAGINKVTLWSDVAGVYSADPHEVKSAELLTFLRLDEVNELARLATPILHTRTLEPVKHHQLTLELRSSLKPEKGITRIEHALSTYPRGKIITYHNKIGIIELVIPKNQQIDSWLKRLQLWLEEKQLDPLVQHLDQQNRTLQLAYTNEYIDQIFVFFKHLPLITDSISIRYDLALLGLVGAGVCQNSLQMLRFSQWLKTQPVELIWQSPQNISIVALLRQPVNKELLRSVHDDLFRAHKKIGIVVLGKGEVAKTWLNLFQTEQEKIAARSHFDFSLVGIVSSQKAWLDYQGLLPQLTETELDNIFDQHAQTLQPTELLQWLKQHPFDELVILDITNSDQVAKHYIDYAKHGFHVISANKRAAAFELEQYHQIENAFYQSGSHWLYNATVGGGLPINTIVQDLVESGDTILSIEGTFSSTLAWLFYQYDGTTPFSQLVESAWQQGMTESDPRDDLSGLDALRKLLIVARSAGYNLDKKDVKIHSLVPNGTETLPLCDFFEQLHQLDQKIFERYQDAQDDHLMLRYVARFQHNGQSSISLDLLSPEDPISQTLPGENLFLIKSLWYRDNPLVIHGPSSGVKLTAGAIQADLNRLVKLL